MSPKNQRSFQATSAAAILLSIESAILLALALYMIALGITHDKAWLPYLSVIGFALAGAAALLTLSKGVRAGKRWANSPAILANLIALGVAKYQFEAGLYWLAIPVALMALILIISSVINVKNSVN